VDKRQGRQTVEPSLGTVDWGVSSGPVNQISRTKLRRHNQSLGVITDPKDEAAGLETEKTGTNARKLRPKEEGLLILYPISRHSGYGSGLGTAREALFPNPNDPRNRDLVGLALSFPRSSIDHPVEAYLEGTVRWRPIA